MGRELEVASCPAVNAFPPRSSVPLWFRKQRGSGRIGPLLPINGAWPEQSNYYFLILSHSLRSGFVQTLVPFCSLVSLVVNTFLPVPSVVKGSNVVRTRPRSRSLLSPKAEDYSVAVTSSNIEIKKLQRTLSIATLDCAEDLAHQLDILSCAHIWSPSAAKNCFRCKSARFPVLPTRRWLLLSSRFL